MFIKSLVPLAIVALVAGRGGNTGSDARSGNLQLLGSTAITGVRAGTNFGFDIGTVVGDRYYVTDRNNAGVTLLTRRRMPW